MNREQAQEQSDKALAELAAALKAGQSEALTKYLDTMSQFHRYSFGNCMLIACQKPDATMVAGFARWKQLGRFVKKGEKGIGIMAPLVGKKKDAEPEEGKVVYGFRMVHVFDISQTEGEDLPDLDLAVTGEPGEKLEQLEQLVARHNIELSYEPEEQMNGALGLSKGGRIAILDSLKEAERFSVLAHELAHEMLHQGERRKTTSKVVRETEAEAVAYVVCRSVGLECGSKTADYIQLYEGDEKLLMQSLECIRSTANSIIAELEGASAKTLQEAA